MPRVWTDDDIEYLREKCATTPHAEIAATLGCSVSAVRHKASRLGIVGRSKSVTMAESWANAAITCEMIRSARVYDNAWTAEEIHYLNENYSDKTSKELADRLGRSKNAVKVKLSLLGLKKGYSSGPDSPAWKGGKKHHNHHWRTAICPQVLARDNWACQNPECAVVDYSGVSLRAHHIIPVRLSEDNSFGNHVTLCQPCHARQVAHRWDEITPEGLESLPEYQKEFLRTTKWME